MKRMVLCLLVVATTCFSAHAQDKKVLRAALAVDKETKPTTSFAPEAPQIYAFYIGQAIKAGDKLRAVWIAEDVGAAAPKGTKIDEASLVASSDNPSDAFSLSKPAKGWPLGKYKVEIYHNDKLAETLNFTISEEASAAEDETDEDDTDEDETPDA